MKSLHIVFFNRAFHPEPSATSQLLTELAEGLARDHHCRISVVAGIPLGTSKTDHPTHQRWGFVQREHLGPISILRARGTRFSKTRFVGRVTNYLTYFGSACWAGLHLERPDVVVALTDPPIIGLAALLSAKRFRCPLVISFRDLFPEVGRLLEDFRSGWVDWILIQANRVMISQAAQLIALGEAMRNRLINEKGANPKRVVVIPDWADTESIKPTLRDNAFSQINGFTDRFVVMHSGNLGVTQNLEVTLESALILQHHKDLLFVFIGEGVRKSSLQNQATRMGLENVRFLPHQPKESLSEVFGAADCFIVSLKPGLSGYIMPSKLYGILAAGRPYVGAVDPECDVARITRTYGCGLLAKPGDPKDLASQIECLYRDRTLAKRLGEQALKASEKFGRRLSVKAYYELCHSLSAQGRTPGKRSQSSPASLTSSES